jgi:hypothetical protein
MKELREEIAQAKKIISLTSETPKMDEILREAKIGSYNPCFLDYHIILEALLDTASEMEIELTPVRGSQTSNGFEIIKDVNERRHTGLEVGYNMLEGVKKVGILIYTKGVHIFVPVDNYISKYSKNRVKKALEIAIM